MRRSAAAAADRPRVLVLAEALNPSWVSVPLVAWNHTRALARVADLHLVTNVKNAPNLVAAGLREGTDFTAFDTGDLDGPVRVVTKVLGDGWTTYTALSALTYAAFERRVWRRLGDRIRSGEWDLVHRLTPLTPTLPSSIAARCAAAGIPFVLGPLNGGAPWPHGYDDTRRSELLTYVRGAYRLLPGYRSTRDHATAIVAASRDTLEQIGARWRPKTVYLPENGVDASRFVPRAGARPGLPVRVVFVGRLVHYKLPDVLIEAAAPLVRAGKVTVEIVGDGPLMPDLRALVARERIEREVALPGWIDHRVLPERLAQADVFGFPSIREFGGAVVIEAMSAGLVPVVVDYAGPAELVSERTGFRVPIGSRAELVTRFRDVLQRLADDPAVLRDLGRRARARVERHFTWDAKAARMLEVYRWALGARGRPDSPIPLPDEAEARAHAAAGRG